MAVCERLTCVACMREGALRTGVSTSITASTCKAFSAFVTNAQAGGVVQGGSTITQQLAKNLFLSNERIYEREINEAFLAIWLEARLSKNEVLKLYLDRAYLGGGAFGVDGAAQYYFGRSVRDVTLPEAAMLAGLFKAPSKFSPLVNLPAARARANVVLDNLVDNGFMTEGRSMARGAIRRHRSIAPPRMRRTIISTGPSTRCAISSKPSRNPLPTASSLCAPHSIPICSIMPSTRSNPNSVSTAATMARASLLLSSPILTAACGAGRFELGQSSDAGPGD